MKIVVNGADSIESVPGLMQAADQFELVFAPDKAHLGEALPDADVLLGWNFQSRDMDGQWCRVNALKWIHWCGAAVDRVMSPELSSSGVLLTNAHGIYNDVMAEYILGYMLSETKNFRETFELQKSRVWRPRVTGKLSGSTALIYGVGSIGRSTARLLRSVGVEVFGVGRRARSSDPDFVQIVTSKQSPELLGRSDWVIGLMPLTNETYDYFDAGFFARMKSGARFLNLGRGESVVESALGDALGRGQIAGAMLDVFQSEPLGVDSPLWDTPNLVVSPHTSSYFAAYEEAMAAQFMANLRRFSNGEKLLNLVDTSLGFVRSDD